MSELLGSLIAREYSDLDLNFAIHPIRKDINHHFGDQAVIHAVKNLIMMNHYDKLFQPDIGCNIRKLLFENMDNITASALDREIRQTITNYEPRVNLKNLSVNPDFDNNAFSITMEFFILNRTDPVTIKFLLHRTR